MVKIIVFNGKNDIQKYKQMYRILEIEAIANW